MNKRIALFIPLFFIVLHAFSQQSITSAGGNMYGSGGSATFSLGQLFYATHNSEKGFVQEGVHQPFLKEATSIHKKNTNASFAISIFPNPVINQLNIEVDENNINYNEIEYTVCLYNSTGKLIIKETIKEDRTKLNLENLPSSIYLVKIVNNKKTIHTYKIVKD